MHGLIDSEESLWRACFKACADTSLIERFIRSNNPEDAVILAYGPVARRNQFQALLYSESQSCGFLSLPISRQDLFVKIPWVGPFVVHFHWLHDLINKSESREEVDVIVDKFVDEVETIQRRGGKIVWTVHNILPHNQKWPDHDVRINQAIAEAADVIHIMAEDTVELCAPYYLLDPKKVMYVPHPSYLGAQADYLSRAQARAELGISGDAFVFLSFGGILAYKGFGALMACFDRLVSEAEKRTHLVITGPPLDQAVVIEISRWAAGRDDVTLDLRPLPSEELQVYFRASDVAVCPYDRTLNSGAALMAITFDLPVIGPRIGSFIDIVGDECGMLYGKGNFDELFNTMLQATNVSLNHLRASCAMRKESLSPQRISRTFFTELRSRLAANRT